MQMIWIRTHARGENANSHFNINQQVLKGFMPEFSTDFGYFSIYERLNFYVQLS